MTARYSRYPHPTRSISESESPEPEPQRKPAFRRLFRRALTTPAKRKTVRKVPTRDSIGNELVKEEVKAWEEESHEKIIRLEAKLLQSERSRTKFVAQVARYKAKIRIITLARNIAQDEIERLKESMKHELTIDVAESVEITPEPSHSIKVTAPNRRASLVREDSSIKHRNEIKAHKLRFFTIDKHLSECFSTFSIALLESDEKYNQIATAYEELIMKQQFQNQSGWVVPLRFSRQKGIQIDPGIIIIIYSMLFSAIWFYICFVHKASSEGQSFICSLIF